MYASCGGGGEGHANAYTHYKNEWFSYSTCVQGGGGLIMATLVCTYYVNGPLNDKIKNFSQHL